MGKFCAYLGVGPSRPPSPRQDVFPSCHFSYIRLFLRFGAEGRFVVLRDGEHTTKGEIIDFCRGKLGGYKLPPAWRSQPRFTRLG
jgi:hypothetical protein